MKKFINTNKIAIGLLSVLALSLLLMGQQNKVFGMYEDQIEVCNFEQVCQVVNIDDYMTKKASDKLQYNFDNDLDTYDRSDKLASLDLECRDNYHSWCFGEEWNAINEVLSK